MHPLITIATVAGSTLFAGYYMDKYITYIRSHRQLEAQKDAVTVALACTFAGVVAFHICYW